MTSRKVDLKLTPSSSERLNNMFHQQIYEQAVAKADVVV